MNRNIHNSVSKPSYSVAPLEETTIDRGNYSKTFNVRRPEQGDGDSSPSPLDDLMRKLKLGKLQHEEALQKDKRGTLVKKRREASPEKVASSPVPGKDNKAPRFTPRPSRTRRGGIRYPTTERSTQDTEPVQAEPPRVTWRRESLSSLCDSSVSSVDTVPKKKRVDLRPHRSSDLYEAQKDDEELRELLNSKQTNTAFVVVKVHGKSLVFYGSERRVYIPGSLRSKTVKYYQKNYKYTAKQRMAESCYWPDMERDQRRAFQWKVRISEPGKDPKFIYDSDE